MKKVLLMVGFLVFQISFGQITVTKKEQQNDRQNFDDVVVPNIEESEKDNKIYKMSETEANAEFPGGMNKFKFYQSKFYNYPKDKNLNGEILASFVVEKDGLLTDIKVIKDLGFGTKEETIRFLKTSPKWQPAMYNGKKVRCQYTLSINIKSSN